MTESFSLITSLVTAFGLALVFGYLAERFLKTPALVGFLIAGASVSLFPGLPSVDVDMTQQMADIGVMLLMFGVGLHFSVSDLNRVKSVAILGAVSQMVIAATLGTLFAIAVWNWQLGSAVVFGLCLSCASTVVVTKALEMRRLTMSMKGQVAIGWLVVQDLVTVFIMVCLPPFAQVVTGGGAEPAAAAAGVSGAAVLLDLVKTLFGVVLFVVIMMVVGRKVFPEGLRLVALTGSRELFTLAVLAAAIGVAYGAAAIFHVSYALGAFFAGVVMQESRYAHRAAKDSLPLQDAFAVLFFVSIGMMLDWHIFLERPFEVISVVAIIMGVTTTVSATLVVLLRWPLEVALTLAACLAQIGEFSYILAAQGIQLGLADQQMLSLIVAASIVTIALNPLMFAAVPVVRRRFVMRYGWAKRAEMRRPPMTELPADAPVDMRTDQVIVVGSGVLVADMVRLLERTRCRTIVVCSAGSENTELESEHTGVITGDPSDPMVLVQAHIATARALVCTDGDAIEARKILTTARELNNRLTVLVRVRTTDDVKLFGKDEGVTVVCDETERKAYVARSLGAVLGVRLEEASEKNGEEIDDDEAVRDDSREARTAARPKAPKPDASEETSSISGALVSLKTRLGALFSKKGA